MNLGTGTRKDKPMFETIFKTVMSALVVSAVVGALTTWSRVNTVEHEVARVKTGQCEIRQDTRFILCKMGEKSHCEKLKCAD